MAVGVQQAAFDPGTRLNALHAGSLGVGAVACLVGYMRDFNQDHRVREMYLEHYPGMTEKALEDIAEQASRRWPLQAIDILHRVGRLLPAEPIVFVGVASAHRREALEACAFVMDYLKTRAPLWKKEDTEAGARWVEGRASDQQAAAAWDQND